MRGKFRVGCFLPAWVSQVLRSGTCRLLSASTLRVRERVSVRVPVCACMCVCVCRVEKEVRDRYLQHVLKGNKEGLKVRRRRRRRESHRGAF